MRERRGERRAGPGESEAGPLPSREHKVAFVRAMFARIAPHYDTMNRLMTFGFDRRWRRLAVREALGRTHGALPMEEKRQSQVLDVGTGTGDLALELLRQEPTLHVVGLDLVPEMLAIAQHKAGSLAVRAAPGGTGETVGRLDLVLGDALHLPFGDGEFDAVVTGFALRNVLDIPVAFSEMARVTRPGGRVACLELAKPRLPLFRHLFALYFFRLVPFLGRIMAGEAVAYTYLPHSLAVFLTPAEIAGVMQASGWREVRCRRLMLGTVALHTGVRERHTGTTTGSPAS
jgi:demethylmenaquinone methyltransferase/2-methoxy-6-polyprenyl-1,4-benzoquinol methylase